MRLHGTGALKYQFGLFTGTTGITWPQLVDLWQHAEATGWDMACVTDHFMPNGPDPVDIGRDEEVRSSVMPKGVEHNKPGPEALEIISHTERR